jgi:hypothetical protein
LIILLYIFNNNYSKFLPLPKEFANLEIFHFYSPQINHLACGYNDLFYAYSIEKYLYKGELDKIDQNRFFNTIKRLKYKENNNLIKKDDFSYITNNHMLLLSKALGLKEYNYIYIEDKNIYFYISNEIRIITKRFYTKQDIENIFKNYIKGQTYNKIRYLKDKLYKNKKLYIIHFFCHIENGDNNNNHVILLTLIQKNNRKSLYIFDNLNQIIQPNSQHYKYIKYINKNFKISYKK